MTRIEDPDARSAAPASGGHRWPVVGVMGSGSIEHAARAEPLGRWLADWPVHLLTGGGAGVMRAVSRGYRSNPSRRGAVIGVLPADEGRVNAPPGYPNDEVEIVIRTHLPFRGARGTEDLSRNPINVLTSDVLIALPGGAGTSSEVELALRYGRPIIGYLEERDEIPGIADSVPVVSTLEALSEFLREHLGDRADR